MAQKKTKTSSKEVQQPKARETANVYFSLFSLPGADGVTLFSVALCNDKRRKRANKRQSSSNTNWFSMQVNKRHQQR